MNDGMSLTAGDITILVVLGFLILSLALLVVIKYLYLPNDFVNKQIKKDIWNLDEDDSQL